MSLFYKFIFCFIFIAWFLLLLFWAGFNFVSSRALEWVTNVFIAPLDLQFVHISKLFDANHFYHLHMFAFWIAPYTKQVSLSFLTVWFGWLHFTGHETISLDLLSFFINARWFNRWWLPALINRDFFPDGQSYKSDCCVPKVLAFSCPEFAAERIFLM